MSMATVALKRDNAMNSVPSDNSEAVKGMMGGKAGRAPASGGPESSKLVDGSSALGADKSGQGITAEQAKQLAEALSKMKGPKASALREKLRRQLAGLEGGNNGKPGAEGTEAFDGKLTGTGLGATDKGSSAISEPGLAAQAVSSALHAPENSGSTSGTNNGANAFSLAGPETDAAVKQLQANAANDSSIAEQDSPTLFERVHVAHTKCVRKQCVAAK